MAASDETSGLQSDQPGPTEPETDAAEDDTAGHSTFTYDYSRQHASERSREADDWARKAAVRKQAKSLLDRLRGR